MLCQSFIIKKGTYFFPQIENPNMPVATKRGIIIIASSINASDGCVRFKS